MDATFTTNETPAPLRTRRPGLGEPVFNDPAAAATALNESALLQSPQQTTDGLGCVERRPGQFSRRGSRRESIHFAAVPVHWMGSSPNTVVRSISRDEFGS
jgi:hypothetical protein